MLSKRQASSLERAYTLGAPADAPAPRWHTAVLVGLFVLVALLGALTQHGGGATTASARQVAAGGRIAGLYVPMLAVQWGLALYVARVGRGRWALGSLLGARATPVSARSLARDLALGAALGALIRAGEAAWDRLAGHGATPPAVLTLLPRTPLEKMVWVLVAASVGLCEELVFRGYLQAQFLAFWRRASLAVALQALLFGLAHGEQGVASAVRVALYGVLLGAVAHWRRSIVPGVVCHVGTDLASGLLGAY